MPHIELVGVGKLGQTNSDRRWKALLTYGVTIVTQLQGEGPYWKQLFAQYCVSDSRDKFNKSGSECFLLWLQMADQQQEHQRETEGLLDSIRELRRELLLDQLIIDTFIPMEFQVSW